MGCLRLIGCGAGAVMLLFVLLIAGTAFDHHMTNLHRESTAHSEAVETARSFSDDVKGLAVQGEGEGLKPSSSITVVGLNELDHSGNLINSPSSGITNFGIRMIKVIPVGHNARVTFESATEYVQVSILGGAQIYIFLCYSETISQVNGKIASSLKALECENPLIPV